MDRRIKKNQEAIMNSFIGLMSEKDFRKITINEIAERADVNRGTIYSHYLDKYDLLDACIEFHLEQLIQNCMPDEGQRAYLSKHSLLRTFEIMEKNAFFYRTLLTNTGVPAFRNRLAELMKQGIKEQLIATNRNQIQQDILVQFLSSATVGVVEWWFTSSMPYSAADISEQLWALLENNQMIPPVIDDINC
ncbi:TetR/AcrR family transcriptional regulator [Paenibacillus sp. HWE-109]|uniref:TetR/AcrR family transcriptional regulator n=1 Tax=Paenibacillus sp. HWE-109 TaxID=1306526 RepID=UPI001EDE700B|nr:TetR/AcrR family transcriptional regulator [Paenibacillus sp. HWE-109]UKS27852.1 TetR/AcrR family transcriptional regulator [Paenibacillus sp. HWE-109]